MNSISSRVKEIVDVHHHGSVTAAARAMRIPQRTLARIVTGKSQIPADAIPRIAMLYSLSLDWLLTGEGSGPKRQEGSQGLGGYQGSDVGFHLWSNASLQWVGLVLSLGLYETDVALHNAVLNLPHSANQASLLLHREQPALEEIGGIARGTPLLRLAAKRELETWIAWVEGWLKLVGRDELRARLEGHAKEFGERLVNVPRFVQPRPSRRAPRSR
ncbi:MAG: hypothetical protein ACR2G6_02040 [Gemmatimonadaceae bacterium]